MIAHADPASACAHTPEASSRKRSPSPEATRTALKRSLPNANDRDAKAARATRYLRPLLYDVHSAARVSDLAPTAPLSTLRPTETRRLTAGARAAGEAQSATTKLRRGEDSATLFSCADTFTLGEYECVKRKHEFIHPTAMDVDHASGTNVVFVRMFSEPEVIVMLDTAGAQARTVWEKVIIPTHPRRKVSHVKYINRSAILVGFHVAGNNVGHADVVTIVDAATGIDVMSSVNLPHEISGIASARYTGRAVVWDKRGCATMINPSGAAIAWHDEISSWCTEYDVDGCMAVTAAGFGKVALAEDLKQENDCVVTPADDWVSCAVSPEGDLIVFGGKAGRLLMVAGFLHGYRGTPRLVWDTQLAAEEWTVHFAAAGSAVICHDGVGTVKALNSRTGAPTWSMNTCPLIFYPNGDFGITGVVVSDHEDTSVRAPGSSQNSTADFSIVCLGENGEVQRLLFEKGVCVKSNMVEMQHTQMRACVAPSGNNLLCATSDGTVTLLDSDLNTEFLTILGLPDELLVYISLRVPMSCGLSTINLRFWNLELSAYQPMSVEFPRVHKSRALRSFMPHHEKVLNRRRSCIVVPAVNRVVLESLVNEFEQNRSLSSIILSNTHIVQEIDIDKEFAEQIAKGITASASLTHIDLSSTRLSDEGTKHIADGISVSASLTYISLERNKIGPEGGKAIAEGIAVSASLTDINLSNNNLTDYGEQMSGIQAIAEAIGVSASLTSIDLSCNEIDAEGVKHIAKAISVSASLTHINLSYNDLGDKGAKYIAEGISVSASLTKIDLRNNQLCGVNEYCGYDTYTTEGIQAIASAISVSASLTSINLERNQIRSKGAEHIAKGISVSASLTSVNLLGNTFDDETVLMLLETKKEKPSLLTLCGLDRDATAADFRRKRLDSRDAKLLAPEIAVSASLTSIDLSDNHLNDKAAKHIAKAISVSASLTSIDLSDNYRIRADGERAITEAMYVSASLTSINLS